MSSDRSDSEDEGTQRRAIAMKRKRGISPEGEQRIEKKVKTADTKIIPKLTTAEIGYSQTGFDKLDAFKTPNAVINGSLGYSLGGNTQLVGSYQERYVDLDGNGKIKGEDETITSMSMGVEFSF